MVADNPYTTQTQQPGKDHGLWDVIGRAIRSQVPTRENKAFDKTKPVGEGNMPYENPGFFRALAGDRARDYNNDAMLRQRDLDTADTLEGKNFAGWKKGQEIEDASDMERLEKQFGYNTKLQQMANEAHQSLENLAQRGRREIADTTGINWMNREMQRGRNALGLAEYKARHPQPLRVTPEQQDLMRERAAALRTKRIASEGMLPSPGSATTSSQPGFLQGLKNSIFPSASTLTNNIPRIKINAADIPGRGGLKPTDMKSSGAVQNGILPADYDDPSLLDDDDDSDLMAPYNGFNMQY